MLSRRRGKIAIIGAYKARGGGKESLDQVQRRGG